MWAKFILWLKKIGEVIASLSSINAIKKLINNPPPFKLRLQQVKELLTQLSDNASVATSFDEFGNLIGVDALINTVTSIQKDCLLVGSWFPKTWVKIAEFRVLLENWKLHPSTDKTKQLRFLRKKSRYTMICHCFLLCHIIASRFLPV